MRLLLTHSVSGPDKRVHVIVKTADLIIYIHAPGCRSGLRLTGSNPFGYKTRI